MCPSLEVLELSWGVGGCLGKVGGSVCVGPWVLFQRFRRRQAVLLLLLFAGLEVSEVGRLSDEGCRAVAKVLVSG